MAGFGGFGASPTPAAHSTRSNAGRVCCMQKALPALLSLPSLLRAAQQTSQGCKAPSCSHKPTLPSSRSRAPSQHTHSLLASPAREPRSTGNFGAPAAGGLAFGAKPAAAPSPFAPQQAASPFGAPAGSAFGAPAAQTTSFGAPVRPTAAFGFEPYAGVVEMTLLFSTATLVHELTPFMHPSPATD
jgi:hypothetical protein